MKGKSTTIEEVYEYMQAVLYIMITKMLAKKDNKIGWQESFSGNDGRIYSFEQRIDTSNNLLCDLFIGTHY